MSIFQAESKVSCEGTSKRVKYCSSSVISHTGSLLAVETSPSIWCLLWPSTVVDITNSLSHRCVVLYCVILHIYVLQRHCAKELLVGCTTEPCSGWHRSSCSGGIYTR
jgi:hypothetical protein